jgi:hypothetical protein
MGFVDFMKEMFERQYAADYWEFERFVKRRSRHFFDERLDAFLKGIVGTSEKRKRRWSSGSILWRAQLGFKYPSSNREWKGSLGL